MRRTEFQKRYRVAVRRALREQRFVETAFCWFCVTAFAVMLFSMAV